MTTNASPEPAAPAAAPPGDASRDRGAALDDAVRALVNNRMFRDAQIGVALLDVDTGAVMGAANEHLPLNPASAMKLYTAATALALLHTDHRYETSLSGSVTKGVVNGPLVLRGYGDPSLSTADLRAMVDELRAQGIRRIDGDLLVDHRFYDEQTVPPGFEQQPNEWAAFRAPISAVAVNENTITLAVRPTSVGQPAGIVFDPPGFVDIDGKVTTARSGADAVILALSPNGKRMSAKLGGTIAANSRLVRYTRRVDDPTLLAGFALRSLLDEAQIKLSGEVKAGKTKPLPNLVRHTSAPLGTLIQELGKSSDNFYAEMIFKTLAGEVKATPARSADGGEVMVRWLDRVGANDTGLTIKNGSGLFDSNRVTAASVAQLLRVVWRDPTIQPEFVAQLSIGGVDGTLQRRFREERTRRAVRAKTGTLDATIALCGYVLSPPGRGPIAFAILFNKVAGKGGAARAAIDAFVEKVVASRW